MRFFLSAVLLTAMPLISVTVLERRHRLSKILTRAIGSSGLQGKAIAGELGRDQSHLNRLVEDGTLHVADLFSMPEPLRTQVVDELLASEGVLTLNHAVQALASALEDRLLQTIEPAKPGERRQRLAS